MLGLQSGGKYDKILMYTVRPDERAAIDAWVAANDIQVDTNTVEFGPDTVDLAKGV